MPCFSNYKRIFRLILLFSLPVLYGMASLQSPATPDKLPIPTKKFTITFIDQMDVVTEGTEASIEGNIFLEGKKGEGIYTVAFENIDSINFLQTKDNLVARVKLRDGSILELTTNKKQKAFGRTKYGTFQVMLSDLKSMIVGREVR